MSRTRRRSSRGQLTGAPTSSDRCALLAQLGQLSDVAREAAERAGLGRRVPQPVQVDRRPRGGDSLRLRRGAPPDRGLRASGCPSDGDGVEGRGRDGVERGPARDALAPLPAQGRRLDRGSADRAADLPEPGPDRAGPVGVRPVARRACPTIACSGNASRRSATTIRASAARPISSSSTCTGRDRVTFTIGPGWH